MKHLSTASQRCPIQQLRFHPRERLLASIAGPGKEVFVWRWDDSGTLECVTRINQAESVRGVCWHPHESILALVGGGRPIELWSGGHLLKTLGKSPVPGRTRMQHYGHRVAGGPWESRTSTQEIPLASQGYSAVAFRENGDRLVASRFGESLDDENSSEVYDVVSGQLAGSFWRSDTTLALHPEGEILATLSSNQMASSVRFGLLGDTFQGYDVQLNVDVDGYRRIVFSPKGDAFALMGHAYAVGFKIYEFPSCRAIFEMDFEAWEDVYDRLWNEWRGAERYSAKPDGSYPHAFLKDLGVLNDRLAFHPDGRSLLIGMMDGLVVGVGLEDLSKPSGVWTAHDKPVLALDVSASHAVMATACCNGEIKLWSLDDAAAVSAPVGKPITEAFLRMYEPINSTASEDQFRTTDGKRWYDFETIGAEDIGEDAPPWAQIANWMSRKDRPGPEH